MVSLHSAHFHLDMLALFFGQLDRVGHKLPYAVIRQMIRAYSFPLLDLDSTGPHVLREHHDQFLCPKNIDEPVTVQLFRWTTTMECGDEMGYMATVLKE